MTVEEFDDFAELPQNRDKILEYIGGEVVEVPSNAYRIENGQDRFRRNVHLPQGQPDLGYLTGEAGGYMVSGERYAPDVAYISKAAAAGAGAARLQSLPARSRLLKSISPRLTESQRDLRPKSSNYLAAGTVVWVVLPEARGNRSLHPAVNRVKLPHH